MDQVRRRVLQFICLTPFALVLKACGGIGGETVHDRLVATGIFGFQDVPHGGGLHPVVVQFGRRRIPFPTGRCIASGNPCFTIYVNGKPLENAYLEDHPLRPEDEVTVDITAFVA